jgi:Polyketide cyclase / dehydrase and lipid transport
MLFVALPFIWLGLAMTVKRLRDGGQPTWLAALFFAPIANLAFFVALSFMPSVAESKREEGTPWPGVRAFDRWIPRNAAGSALVSIGATCLLGLFLTFLGTKAIAQYGWGLFVGLPFCLGLFAVLTHSYHQQRSYGECVTVAVLPVAMLGAVLMLVAIEGVICIMMAAPLAFCLALLGGSLGYGIQAAHWGRRHAPAMLGMVLLFTPGFYGIEHFTRPQPGVFEVKSAIEINAPPEKVWQKVIAFTEIPPPKETLFRVGVAYPIRAEIAGHGPGAVRHCVFSTGPFVEPITVWDEPHLLRFSVTENPAPMNELTPYGHIEPKHLHGYFESHQGQFLLTELPGGRTRVEGTTWYSHSMWPETYWHWWSDYIIHRIHLRVLNHIRMEVGGS